MENNFKEKFKSELWLLYREAYFAKSQYILFYDIYQLLLRNTSYKYFFSTIFDSLEFSILLKLTKIYDEDPDKQSITLLHIINKIQSNKVLNKDDSLIKNYLSEVTEKLKNNKGEITKIKTCRDKVVSHMDKKYPKGLLSLKPDEIINFDLLKKYSYYAYDTLKNIYELVYNEELSDTKQLEILKLEYENIIKKIENTLDWINKGAIFSPFILFSQRVNH